LNRVASTNNANDAGAESGGRRKERGRRSAISVC